MSEIDSMPLEGSAAPPMANGEVVFEAPWQSRVFGLARVLCEAGHYTWDEFRERLIANIAAWEASQAEEAGETYEYFDCFLGALTDMLECADLCDLNLLSQKELEFAARPHGHDH